MSTEQGKNQTIHYREFSKNKPGKMYWALLQNIIEKKLQFITLNVNVLLSNITFIIFAVFDVWNNADRR